MVLWRLVNFLWCAGFAGFNGYELAHGGGVIYAICGAVVLGLAMLWLALVIEDMKDAAR